MRQIFKVGKNEKGQSIVEFALVLPILLLLVLGLIQFGIIFSSQIAVTNAAREGARMASVGSPRTDVVARINHSIGGHVFLPTLSDSNVVITPATPTVGNEITVEIRNVALTLFVPVPDVFIPGSTIKLGGKASMRLEKKAD